MLTFIAVCVGVLTAAHVAALAVWIATAAQVRRTAEAVEALAYRTQDQVARLSQATDRMRDLTSWLNSGWLRAFSTTLETLLAFWTRRSNAEKTRTPQGD